MENGSARSPGQEKAIGTVPQGASERATAPDGAKRARAIRDEASVLLHPVPSPSRPAGACTVPPAKPCASAVALAGGSYDVVALAGGS